MVKGSSSPTSRANASLRRAAQTSQLQPQHLRSEVRNEPRAVLAPDRIPRQAFGPECRIAESRSTGYSFAARSWRLLSRKRTSLLDSTPPLSEMAFSWFRRKAAQPASPEPVPAQPEVDSGCTGVCELDMATQLCQGCLRTISEIGNWRHMTSEQKLAVNAAAEERRAGLA